MLLLPFILLNKTLVKINRIDLIYFCFTKNKYMPFEHILIRVELTTFFPNESRFEIFIKISNRD